MEVMKQRQKRSSQMILILVMMQRPKFSINRILHYEVVANSGEFTFKRCCACVYFFLS